jgi:thiol peroxidase
MTNLRSGEAFEGDMQLTVRGRKLQPGDAAPSFLLESLHAGAPFTHTVSLADSVGAVRVLHVVNSVDTPVCHVGGCRWETLQRDLPAGARLYTISMDLPFAQLRWRDANGVAHELLSAHKDTQFGTDYGVLLDEWRLLQRAVFVLDGQGTVRHAEYVADQMQEPDYDAAVRAAKVGM